MSKLLFDESPLTINRKLAMLIGVNEAIVLQQIHYWLEINKAKASNFHDGKYWTYNSIGDWIEKDFPFFKERTLQRLLNELKKVGLLETGNFNQYKFDKTTWYTINYQKLDQMLEESSSCQNGIIEETKNVDDSAKVAEGTCQNGITKTSDWHDEDDKMAVPIPEISSETSSEISPKTSSSSEEGVVTFENVIAFFQENFYLLKGFEVEVLHSWLDVFDAQMILEALKVTRLNNARNMTYVERVLSNWQQDGITNMPLLAEHLRKRGKGHASNSRSTESGDNHGQYDGIGIIGSDL